MAVDTELVATARRLAIFSDLDAEELESVLGSLEEVSFAEGEWIVRRDETDVGLYVILDGEAGVILDDEELATLPTGSFFGEISTLLCEPTVADVVTRSPLRCLFVPPADVKAFLLANPLVMLRMLEAEARRVRSTDELRA